MKAQYTYDAAGNVVGVFIPMEQWHAILDRCSTLAEIATVDLSARSVRMAFLEEADPAFIPLSEFSVDPK
jgi:hypothetical protein